MTLLRVGAAFLLFASIVAQSSAEEVIKAGIIGCDTSHVVEFTKEFNADNAAPDLGGIKVVAAFPGGSPDIPSSKDRLPGFVEKLKGMHVEIVDSIEILLTKVDVVLLESVDGRTHLQQIQAVLKAKKPVFVDKPLAGTLADAVAIYRVAKDAGVPIFSSSSLRYGPALEGVKADPRLGEILGCEAWGPCTLEAHHPDLFWYGIHGVEALYTVMGPGCQSVTRTQTKDYELVVGVWKDGRIGTFRGLRAGAHDYGVTVYGSKSVRQGTGFGGYRPLLVEVAKFFKTGKAPVSAEETLEIYTFMEAADESKRREGKAVKLEGLPPLSVPPAN